MSDTVLTKPPNAAEIRAELEAMVVGDLLGPAGGESEEDKGAGLSRPSQIQRRDREEEVTPSRPLSLCEAAEALGYSPKRLGLLLTRAGFDAVMKPGHWRIPPDKLETIRERLSECRKERAGTRSRNEKTTRKGPSISTGPRMDASAGEVLAFMTRGSRKPSPTS